MKWMTSEPVRVQRLKSAILLCALCVYLSLFTRFGPSLKAADAGPLQPDAFLSRYCLECHDTKVRKGDRRLDDLPLNIGADRVAAERWQEVLHQIQLGEMPPAKKKQPTDVERRALLGWIGDQLARAQSGAEDRADRVVHRRLSRAEYLHTIQDLFGFEEDFDPTTSFPGDEEFEGFRNIGSALRTSRHHLEQYLKAADAVLDHAYDLAEVKGKPEVKQWKDSAENMRSLNDAFGLGVISAEKAKGAAYIHLSHGLRNQELIFDSKLFLSKLGDIGVPHSGWYEVEVEATAANRHHPYGKDFMNGGLVPYFKDLKSYYDESQPMQLGIGRQGEGIKGNGWRLIPPNIVHATELPDDRYLTVRARVWLDCGTVPYLSWIDGPPKGTRGNFISTKLYKYDPSVPKIEKQVWENLALRAERDKLYQHLYQGPEIRVRYWQVTGPLRGDKPHPARTLLFAHIAPDEKQIEPVHLQTELQALASRLFRREVTADDIAPFASAVQKRLDGKTRYADAVRPVFKALLCSSEFLFLTRLSSEAQPSVGREANRSIGENRSGGSASPSLPVFLPPHQLATRLSYFLTAGPPDEPLRALATKGPLEASSIRRETDRLLDSPRANRFMRLFTEQWLGLTKLGTMPPSKETFPNYHIDRLEVAMKEETWRVIAELIRTNQPVTALVDCQFTYLNAGLARLYQMPESVGQGDGETGRPEVPQKSPPASPPESVMVSSSRALAGFTRVRLPADSLRRGLLGHASVLTVSANGVETSPVKRGVWLLEKLFGTPPGPPPPNVPPIEPDIRGAITIRQQLEKHRHVQACADCHAKIDPLGFALEAFDPIGQVRASYPNGTAIDTAGEYRGEPINSPDDIRAYLVRHPDLLAHNVAHRLLTYALGRPLGFADQPVLRRLLADWKTHDYKLRELIQLITSSDLMRQP
jgi:mono/diheme cytochrome c family protein